MLRLYSAPLKIFVLFEMESREIRLERADFESEIDSELDTGPTTFCCVPRFVAHWFTYRKLLGKKLIEYFQMEG